MRLPYDGWSAAVAINPARVAMGIAALHSSYDFEYAFAFSRHDLPEVLHFVSPHKYRGRREDRVRAAPAVSRAVCI
jgi:hypothetical protein